MAATTHTCTERHACICRVDQNRIHTPYTEYDRILGDFPAKNTVYTPYIYGSGQRYEYVGRVDRAGPSS